MRRGLRTQHLYSALDAFGERALDLHRLERRLRTLHSVVHMRHALGDMIDHRSLRAQYLKVDAKSSSTFTMTDDIGLELYLVDQLLACLDHSHPLLGLAGALEGRIELGAENVHLVAMVHDVLEVLSAPLADLVDLADALLDQPDERLTGCDGLNRPLRCR